MNPPRVFISYSHDSVEQLDRVLQFSNQLRIDGIDATIDQYEIAPPEGWPQWCLHQVQESEFVLVVCTETYKRRFDGKEVQGIGKGVAWEGQIVIQKIYDEQSKNKKFIPITFNAEDLKFIPDILRAASFYNVARPREYESLYRRLTDQPAILKPQIGKLTQLPAKTKHAAATPPPMGPMHNLGPSDTPQALGSSVVLAETSVTAGKKKTNRNVAPDSPTIYAYFELKNGEPLMHKKSYKIWVAVRNVPDGTEKVHYEILDDTFSDPKFSVPWGRKDFAEWITSYGDVFLTARGKASAGPWRAQTTLVEALRACYGRTPKTIIRKAIHDIENN